MTFSLCRQAPRCLLLQWESLANLAQFLLPWGSLNQTKYAVGDESEPLLPNGTILGEEGASSAKPSFTR
jgi:hypothetical protein